MQIFGVGPLELLLVLLLALIILGPEDMVGTSRKIGQWIYRIVRSPTWRAIISTTQDLRELPQKIVREAGIEEAMNEVKDTIKDAKTQVSAATSEVSSEMQAATREVNSEMRVASQQVSQNMQLPGTRSTSPNYSNPTPSDNNQIWPEQALAGYNPPASASINAGNYGGTNTGVNLGVYPTSMPHSPSYAMQLEEFGRALATGPRSAADLEGIVRPPEPPPPTLVAPALIAGALSFVAFGAAPADLEVPFVFADPTDYPDPEPAVEAPPAPAEPPAETPNAVQTADAPAIETGETLSALVESGEQPTLPDEDTINAGLARAMEQRMREMDEAIARLDAKIAQDTQLAVDSSPPTGEETATEA